MRLCISIRGCVRPSVRWSRVIFERSKMFSPMSRWRQNLTWTKRYPRTIHNLWIINNIKMLVHVSVHPSDVIFERGKLKEMINKCQRGGSISRTARFLFFSSRFWALARRRRTWTWLVSRQPVSWRCGKLHSGHHNIQMKVAIINVKEFWWDSDSF